MSRYVRNCLFVLLSLVLLVSLSCSSPKAGETKSPIEITDQLGRVVKLDKIPQRIISLAPSNTEILFALGLADKVVAVTDYCNYPPEAKAETQYRRFFHTEHRENGRSFPGPGTGDLNPSKAGYPSILSKEE